MTDETGTGWMANYPRHLVEKFAAGEPGEGQRVAQAELERRDRPPGTIDIGRQIAGRKGSSWHIVATSTRLEADEPLYGDEERHETVGTLCGRRFNAVVVEVDERAIRHDGRDVCGNCRDQLAAKLTAGRSAGIVHEPTRSATRRPTERSTMTTSTKTPRGKTPSVPLLEPASYAAQKLERLQAERQTINNRLSGLGTQIKRHNAAGNPTKADAAEARKQELVDRRTLLAQAIADKGGDLAAVTHAGAKDAAASTPTPAKRSTAKRSPAKRSNAKRATAKRAPAKRTAAKRSNAKKATAKRAGSKRSPTKKAQ